MQYKHQSHILIMDNKDEELSLLEKSLKQLDCNIVTATTMEKGLTYIKQYDFACILADIQSLLSNQGEGFIQLLKLDEKTRQIPLMVLSDKECNSDFLKGYELGAVDCISKPINATMLNAKIKHYLNFYQQKLQMRHLLMEQKLLLNELNSLAYYDSLTNLCNRRKFLDLAKNVEYSASRYKDEFAILLLDLDGFKFVNDTHGHDVGDKLLVEVAMRLKKMLRQSDLIGRLGGDEFAILLQRIEDRASVAVVADKINQVVADKFRIDGTDIKISTSIGIACFPISGNNIKTLFKHADIAMYQAKTKGKSTYHFYSELSDINYNRNFQIESELYQALEKDEFYQEYQPIIDLETNKMVGVEVLLRWQNSLLGKVSPDEFIPLAEKCKVIASLSLWCIHHACRQYDIWCRKYQLNNFRLALNLSPYPLTDLTFIDQIVEVINSYSINLGNITIELTESAFDGHYKDIETALEKLANYHFNISIDDFGTGYSSLARLSKLPVTELKIDKTFVQDIGINSSAEAIINLTLSLAKTMGLDVIAEGVELSQHIDFLRKQGCRYVQGFYHSKSVSAEEISTKLSQGWTFKN